MSLFAIKLVAGIAIGIVVALAGVLVLLVLLGMTGNDHDLEERDWRDY